MRKYQHPSVNVYNAKCQVNIREDMKLAANAPRPLTKQQEQELWFEPHF